MATILGEAPLSDDILWSAGSRLLDRNNLPGNTAQDLDDTIAARKTILDQWVQGSGGVLKNNAPLWYYILREAEYYGVMHKPDDPGIGFGGQHLGPVGSRIVCETLIGLLWMDPSSFLHSLRGFQPLPEVAGGGELTLGKLITYALT